MAPPKETTQIERERSARKTYNAIFLDKFDSNTIAAFSDVKGLFNRIAKQDQWDWFTVCGQMGYPSARISSVIASALKSLRREIGEGSSCLDSVHGDMLRRLPLRRCLKVFLGEITIKDEPDAGWLYYLSNRETPDIAKIGMTTRTIEGRVREINGATGILHPFGVRACWRVREPAVVERLIHEVLGENRIRRDREFFRVSFHKARSQIQSAIAESGFEIRTLDALAALSD